MRPTLSAGFATIRLRLFARRAWDAFRSQSSDVWLGTAAALSFCAYALSRFSSTTYKLAGQIVIDDAFITYRYAENLARGLGPTWNAIDAPIEGYTSPLYMVLLALGRLVTRVDIPSLSVALCLLFACGALAGLFALLYRLTLRVAWAALGAGLLALHPAFAVWAVGGLEHALAACLVVLSLWAMHLAFETQSRRAWVLVAISLWALAEVRTEGCLLSVACCLVLMLHGKKEWPWKTILACGGAVVGALMLHQVFRMLYYGLFFPLPVYQKGKAFQNEPGVIAFVREHGVFVLLWCVALVRRTEAPLRPLLDFAALSGLCMLFALDHVDATMGLHHRYYVWFLPLLFLGTTLGIRELARTANSGASAVLAVCLVAFGLGRGVVGGGRGSYEQRAMEYSRGVNASHLTLGRFLAEHVTTPNALAAAGDCGVTPYYAPNVRFIDVAGLNDPHIARFGYDTSYIFGRNPELIILRPYAWDGTLYDDPRLKRGYVEWARFQGFYDLILFRRRDFVR
jgi:hypothetical protein